MIKVKTMFLSKVHVCKGFIIDYHVDQPFEGTTDEILKNKEAINYILKGLYKHYNAM